MPVECRGMLQGAGSEVFTAVGGGTDVRPPGLSAAHLVHGLVDSAYSGERQVTRITVEP
jgi:hypothetical protein